eukprot:FR743894.1.p3 GENE.FR743894.1~~FR743894.1.p3  ORF type:complete len:110 (+),score=51.14 FR743894.1:748-1077(+)
MCFRISKLTGKQERLYSRTLLSLGVLVKKKKKKKKKKTRKGGTPRARARGTPYSKTGRPPGGNSRFCSLLRGVIWAPLGKQGPNRFPGGKLLSPSTFPNKNTNPKTPKR